jgi:ectoine hydroxylase-related dioxygenase (phytanoyl-CoA dioxygenase family)
MSESTTLEHLIQDTASTIAEINDRGYSIIPNVISPEQADEVRGILEELRLAEMKPEYLEVKAQRVGRIAVKNPIFRDLMCHPTIVKLWQTWLGEDMICSTWSGNTILPGNESMGWHADFPYWSMKAPWPAGILTGQTIWMLDDFTVENGGTGVVPYSHLKLESPDRPYEWHDDGEIITGTRGSVAVLHGALWHTPRPNASDQSRSALLGMYIRPSLLTQENMRGQLADIPDASPLLQQLMGANVWHPKDVVG